MNTSEILSARRRHLGPSLSLSYEQPLHIVRGEGAYLYDENGRAYLDLVNNVCHVGHCHPHVVEAARRQIGELNTNTRYLHEHIVRYAERLAATFPEPLDVCYFTCTGSEANDLALRMARIASGGSDAVVLAGAYHGNTSSLVELSPYKYAGPGGQGRAPHVLEAPVPDTYRGAHRDAGSGRQYADELGAIVADAGDRGRKVAAFFCESMLGCAGQVDLPPGYLKAAYEHVRDAGGLCIADEVQVGFGRCGSHMWAFERQGVVPDIVTLGKPIGNGHPLAAVVTTRAIAEAFDNGMEYFNTFGGNPVSCAIGNAVLDVIERESLRERAQELGDHLAGRLRELRERHRGVGDTRGAGLFQGVELVRDESTREPDSERSYRVVEAIKRQQILLSVDGPLHNVLKIKPPMVLSRDDVDRFVDALDACLADTA